MVFNVYTTPVTTDPTAIGCQLLVPGSLYAVCFSSYRACAHRDTVDQPGSFTNTPTTNPHTYPSPNFNPNFHSDFLANHYTISNPAADPFPNPVQHFRGFMVDCSEKLSVPGF